VLVLVRVLVVVVLVVVLDETTTGQDAILLVVSKGGVQDQLYWVWVWVWVSEQVLVLALVLVLVMVLVLVWVMPLVQDLYNLDNAELFHYPSRLLNSCLYNFDETDVHMDSQKQRAH
jgi:hypothetical protein